MSDNYVVSAKNNNLATTSMVLGIIGWVLVILNICFQVATGLFAALTMGLGALLLCCVIPLSCLPPIAWLIGVITGHIGQNQIRETGEGGLGMAKAGLIMGYIGLGLVALTICAVIILSAMGVTIPFLGETMYQW